MYGGSKNLDLTFVELFTLDQCLRTGVGLLCDRDLSGRAVLIPRTRCELKPLDVSHGSLS